MGVKDTVTRFVQERVAFVKEIGLFKAWLMTNPAMGSLFGIKILIDFTNEHPDKYPTLSIQAATTADMLQWSSKLIPALPEDYALIATLVMKVLPKSVITEDYSLLNKIDSKVLDNAAELVKENVDFKEVLGESNSENVEILRKINNGYDKLVTGTELSSMTAF